MKPYYQDALVTLYHGDFRDYLAAWNAADVLIWDPPYGIDYNSGSRRDTLAASIDGDEDTSLRDYALELWRTWDPAQRERPSLTFGSPRVAKPEGVKMTLVWDKGGALGMGDLRIPWKPGHEEIYVLGDWSGARGNRDNDVIRCAPVQSMAKNGRLHPHQKPLALMQELVGKAPHGMVADPTAGVGTTLLAAASLDQRAVGFEVKEDYCEKAARRLERRQPSLAFALSASSAPVDDHPLDPEDREAFEAMQGERERRNIGTTHFFAGTTSSRVGDS